MRRAPSPISPPSNTTQVLLAALAAAALIAPGEALARTRSTTEAASQPPATPDPLIVVVSLRKQRLTVFNKSGTVTQSPISSGQSEFPTPTGVFSIIGKEVEHESNIYEGASMPYMQRLTWSGTAMHAGNLPGYPASHGCVRLPYGFSQHLFGITSINTRVIVTHDDVAPQPFSHPRLFTPAPAEPASDQPMVNAITSKVASLAAIAPAIAAPSPGLLPLPAKAKARFAETAKLLDAAKAAETPRNAVLDRVKAANRAVEAAKGDVESLQNTIDDAEEAAGKLKRSKKAAEAQLAAVMRRADRSSSPDAFAALGQAEETAEAKLINLSDKFDAANDAIAVLKSGLPALNAKVASAWETRRALDDDLRVANQALKDAQTSYAIAKREDARYLKPVSVFVSRKDHRLYVRQGFDAVLEVPVSIANPEQPLGTHVYTAMGVKDGGLTWSVVSLSTPTRAEENRRNKAGTNGRGATASKALDRLEIPQEALDAIQEVVKPGSSLIVSDEGTSEYFGNGTDFTVAVK